MMASHISADELKQKGNELFAQKSFQAAIAKYTEAIASAANATPIPDGEAASSERKRFDTVLYANRSACEAKLDRYAHDVVSFLNV